MSPADSPFAQLPAPGPHPATAELRAYAAGTLAPADEHRIEAHTLDCERCADLLEGFSMTDAATTDQAVAELRTRLQARVGTAEPEPAVTGRAWPRIAAAAALLAVVGGGIWGWEQQHNSVSETATARLETAPPAAQPAPEPAARVPESTASTVAAASAASKPVAPSAATVNADYAAVAPAQSRRSAPLRRASRAVRPDANSSSDGWASAAERGAPPAAALEVPETKADAPADNPSTPAPGAAAGLAGRVAGVAVQTQTATYDMTTADTLAQNSAKKMMPQPAKAKLARASQAAPAIVANTPMPASPAINPAPVGGTTALREYLRREAAGFDPEINNLRLTGTVRVQFVVGADGKISNLKVVRGLRADYDAEALRIVCEGPAWQPGIAGGKRAPLPMEVTVPF